MTIIMKIVAEQTCAVKRDTHSINKSLMDRCLSGRAPRTRYTCQVLGAPLRLVLIRFPRFRSALPLALIIAILAVSTAAILIRLAQTVASSLSIAALRLAFASLALAPFALVRYRRQLRAIPRRDFFLVSLAGLFLALHFGTWITSLEYTTVASSVVLVSTGPLWVALLSPLFLGERMSRAAFYGLILALFGGLRHRHCRRLQLGAWNLLSGSFRNIAWSGALGKRPRSHRSPRAQRLSHHGPSTAANN